MAAEIALGGDEDAESEEEAPTEPLPQGGFFQHLPDAATRLRARFSLHCGDPVRSDRLLCDRYIAVATGAVYTKLGDWPLVNGGKCSTCFSRASRAARIDSGVVP